MITDTLPDYYSQLQVHPDADVQVIKKAYHTLMRDLGAHPDLGGDPEQAKRINEAWEVLQNAAERRTYDAARRRQAASAAPPPPPVRDLPPLGLDEQQWHLLQQRGELKIKGYQAPGDRRCHCRRCDREWLTRSFSGMPQRCPSCRSMEWAWRRYVMCFVCQHAFEVAELHAPTAATERHCPACKTDDWSLRPLVMSCLGCGTPNRVRRSAWERARCGCCGIAFYAKERREQRLWRYVREGWAKAQAWVDRLLLRPLGSL